MSKQKQKAVKEPLIHITKKRNDMIWWQAWLIRGAAVVLALIVCAFIIVLLTGYNPVEVYKKMIEGSFSTTRKVWALLQGIAMLLCISLAVTPAFKMKFWNLGAQGQVLVGALACAACMFYFKNTLPSGLLIVVMLFAAVVAGMIWALIPAFFKAHWNTNESLFTLMMNYIAIQLVSFAIASWVTSGSGVLGLLNSDTNCGWLPSVFGQKYFINVASVVLLTVIMYVYLKYTKHGYEIAVVGGSENTARYIGINVKQVILRTLAFSGAMCGFAGFLLVSGTHHTVTETLEGGMGFTAIMVSWLAKFNPIVMVLTSFLIVFLQRGSSEIATAFRLNESVADIVTGVILFFIIGCEFFIRYKIHFRKKHKEEEE